MKRYLPVLALLAMPLIAAKSVEKPVLSLDGVAAAVKLAPETRAAIAPHITALNAGFEKIVKLHATYAKADKQQRTRLHEDMRAIHEECHAHFQQVASLLTPEQQEAFKEYVHAQMKAAGIQMLPEHEGMLHHEHHS